LMFVARALGEFYVDVGLPALLRAAQIDSSGNEEVLHVRRAAIQAIAVSTSHMQEHDPAWAGEEFDLEAALLELSESDERLVRSETAFALGVLGTPRAVEQLAELAHDPYPDARYNAANALARHGDLRAVGTLAEMLDPAETAGLRYEDDRDVYRFHKRGTILLNALSSTERLARAHPDADFRKLVRPLEDLVAADAETLREAHIEPVFASEAERVLSHLKSL
jgi:HEAT repeat protein